MNLQKVELVTQPTEERRTIQKHYATTNAIRDKSFRLKVAKVGTFHRQSGWNREQGAIWQISAGLFAPTGPLSLSILSH